jgi:uncharacterized repeat protein (TIGR03803 family)
MKGLSSIKQCALLLFCFLALMGGLHAQHYNILHRFGDGTISNDGTSPQSIFLAFDGNFYGITAGGGTNNAGTVFKITPQGVTSVFYVFTSAGGVTAPTSLIQAADGSFYGTTITNQIFHLTQSGQITLLHSFGSSVNLNGVIQAGNDNFYGTIYYGGSAGKGAVFMITPQGVVTVLHNFGDGNVASDGLFPAGSLVQGSDGSFYGTTSQGGTAGEGIVFKITSQGTYTILHHFEDGSVTNDAKQPKVGLIQASDGNFYGVTAGGGNSGHGTVFKVTSQGAVTILHSFLDGTVLNDSFGPSTPLIQGSDGNFYGTTTGGSITIAFLGVTASITQDATIFQMTPQGIITTLHSFGDGSVTNDGSNYPPSTTSLVQGSAGTFYGITESGGISNDGTVFSITPSAIALASPSTASGFVSVPFSYQTAATNHPTSYSAASLPAGLSIDASSGFVSGTPTTIETNTVTLTVTNAAGSSNFTLTITIGPLPVPSITSLLTAYGSAGAAFTYAITGSNNATSYAADVASLTSLANAGLSLNTSTGAITGIPTTVGTFSVNLTATNSAGTSAAATVSIQILAAPATLDQEYSVLHRFGDGTVANDGTYPESIFQGFDGNFYGVTGEGGASYNGGTVFKITPQGVVSMLYAFNPASNVSSPQSLIQAADGSFYGTTDFGQVFHLSQSGELSILHFFSSGSVVLGIIQAGDGNFYGTTVFGQPGGSSTVFMVTPQGAATVLHAFGDGSVANDGLSPSNLVQGSDGSFYGTTSQGGTAGKGIVYKITSKGTYTILHNFGDGTVPNDGELPAAGLIQGSDGNFYGTTYEGGATGQGTAFKMTTQGAVTILHNFPDGSTLNDGHGPRTPLLQGYDGNFYGTTSGIDLPDSFIINQGTIFQMTPQGIVTTLHTFGDGSVTNDGNNNYTGSALIQSSAGNFYGFTSGFSGSNPSNGTLFSIQAMQKPTQAPIYFGAAYQEASIFAPFSFTPKALFGVSGSGNIQPNAVLPQTSGGIMDALISFFLPQSIHKNYALTSWSLNETGVGSIPPNTLQPLYLSFDPTSGTISGTPTQSGTYMLTMTPSNSVNSGAPQPVTIYIDVPPSLSGATVATGTVGTAFSYLVASVPPALSYNASNLPPWLSYNSTTNLVSGTPTTAGAYVFTTSAKNLAGTNTQAVVLTVTGGSSYVPTITGSAIASGSVGTPFTYHITTAHAATALTALIPPCGLAFDASSGTIRGTPNTTGFFQIPITATNGSGTYASVLSLTVLPPTAPTIAGTLTVLAANGLPFFYAIPANGVVGTYAETGALPDGLSFNAATGTISGTPTTNGNSTIQLTIGNDTGMAASTLTLKVQTPTDYGSWTTTYGVTGGANGTPRHDGIPNLLKYALDINPTNEITATDRVALPAVGSTTIGSTQYLTITYRENALADDLAPIVQTCSDLSAWTSANATTSQIGTDPTTGDPIMQAQVPVTSGRQFIRLNITQP